MPSGDPMWKCQFCGKVYYTHNQSACACGSWVNGHFDGRPINRLENTNYTYPPTPKQTDDAFEAFFKNPPKITEKDEKEMRKVFEDVFSNTEVAKPKKESVRINLPPKPKTETLSEAFAKMFTDESEPKLNKALHRTQGTDVINDKDIDDIIRELEEECDPTLNDVYDDIVGNAGKKLSEKELVENIRNKAKNSANRLKDAMTKCDCKEEKLSERGSVHASLVDDDDTNVCTIKELLESLKHDDDDRSDTLVVNLFAGPGAGKSKTAAGIFYDLKEAGINCEVASEYAKDLTWEERHETFKDQIYIFGKQYHRIFRLLGKVDVVITDSPLLLTPVYDGTKSLPLRELVWEEHRKMWTYNVFLKRTQQFNPKGRNHTLEEAKKLDRLILDGLDDCAECYEVFEGNRSGKDAIVKKIMAYLDYRNHSGNY